MANWYIGRQGQQSGPYEDHQMRQLALSGQLVPDDLVWRDGMANWVAAAQVAEIASLFPTPQPAVPPPNYGPPTGYGQPNGYPPPGYQQAPGYPQPLNYRTAMPTAAPPNHLTGAILVTLFCCLPLGIVSIVYAAQVNSKAQAGDWQGAVAASQSASKWLWLSFWLGLVASIMLLGIRIAANAGF